MERVDGEELGCLVDGIPFTTTPKDELRLLHLIVLMKVPEWRYEGLVEDEHIVRLPPRPHLDQTPSSK